MTRYINADEIRWCECCDDEGNVKPYKVAYSDEMPPTVDAVPVSWIEAYAEELKDHDNSFNMMRYFTIIHMLADWESERKEE